MTMPPELSPLALWGFPLLLISGGGLVWRSIMSAMKRHEEKLDSLMTHKIECIRDFASKREVGELDAQVRGMSRTLARLEGKTHTSGRY